MNLLYRTTKAILYPIESIWHNNYSIQGKEYIPKKGPVAFLVGGHACHMDPVHIGFKYPREVHFMAKKELFKNPVMDKLISGYNAFPINREEVERKTLDYTLDLWDKGETVLIFIEGTRTLYGELLSPKKGPAFMALQAVKRGIPVQICPGLFQGSFHMYPAGFVPFLKTLKLKIGETIDPSEYDNVGELTDAVWNSILELK